MKKLLAILITLVMLTGSAFADYGRYEVKDYPWYGKYVSYQQGGKTYVGTEAQYSDMKAIYEQWKTVKTLHKELENKVMGKNDDPRLQRVGMISVLDRLSDKVNSYFGVTNNNWETKVGMQATVDGLTQFRFDEDRNFIKSAYAEYAMSLNLMYMNAVMSEKASDYVKTIKTEWKEVNYYYLVMDKLVSGMKFTAKGFTYSGTISADMKTLIGQGVESIAQTTEQSIKSTQPPAKPIFDLSKLDKDKRMHYDGLDPKPDYVTEEGYGYTGTWFFGEVKDGMTVEQVVMKLGYSQYQYQNKFVYVLEHAPGVKQYVYIMFGNDGKTETLEYSFPIYY